MCVEAIDPYWKHVDMWLVQVKTTIEGYNSYEPFLHNTYPKVVNFGHMMRISETQSEPISEQ